MKYTASLLNAAIKHCTPVGEYSPNNIRSIRMAPEGLQLTFWVGKDSPVIAVTQPDDFTPDEVLRVFTEPYLQNLETLELNSSNNDLLDSLVPEYHGKMLHYITLNGQSYEMDWEQQGGFEPEHYPLDEKVKEAVQSHLLINQGILSDYVSDEVEEPEESDSILEPFQGQINQAIGEILEAYDTAIKPGYQGFYSPVGVLSEGRLYGGERSDEYNNKVTIFLDKLWKEISQDLPALQIEYSDDLSTIAGTMFGAAQNNSAVYAPGIMTHFVYAGSRTWSEARESIEGMLKKSLTIFLTVAIDHNNWREVSVVELNENLRPYLNTFRDTFMRVFILSDLMISSTGVVADSKLSVLLPDRSLKQHGDYMRQAINSANGSDGNLKAASDNTMDPASKGYYYTFRYEFDHKLANATPVFSYKLLEGAMQKGIKPSWENIIIGLDRNKNLVTLQDLAYGGSKTPPGKFMTFTVGAGSRRGKGVFTLGIDASVLSTGKYFVYLDNKPEMASLILQLCDEAVVINAAKVQNNKALGYDYFGKFTQPEDVSRYVPDYILEGAPDFKTDYAVQAGYSVGTWAYYRLILLVMGIKFARMTNTAAFEALGGADAGIVMVVDELKQAEKEFNNFILDMCRSALLPDGYVKRFRNPRKNAKGEEIPYDMPSKHSMWISTFMESYETGVSTLHGYANIGLEGNKELEYSRIITVSQYLTVQNRITDGVVRRYKWSGDGDPKNLGISGSTDSVGDLNLLSNILHISGKTAVFLCGGNDGSDCNLGNAVNWSNPDSVSHKLLDEEARYFAYCGNLTTTNIDDMLGRGRDISKECLYFKPSLLYIDGDPNAAFWTNTIKNVKNAGVDVDEFVHSVTDPATGVIDTRIGFESYLRFAGQSDVASVLRNTASYLNAILSKIGYPGTWRDFAFDMRPEWLLSITDISESLIKGIPATEVASTRPFAGLFRELYPEDFGGSIPSYSNDSGDFSSLFDDSEIDDTDWSDDTEVIQEGVPLAQTSLNIDTPSRPEAQSSLNFDTPTTPVVAPAIPMYGETVPMSQIPTSSRGTGYGIEDAGVHVPERVSIMPEPQTFTKSDARDIPVFAPDVNQLQAVLMADIEQAIGGFGRIRTFDVQGGALAFNGVAYNPRINPQGFDMSMLPIDVQAALKAGVLAGLFDWTRLASMRNLTRLSFDSVEFVDNYVRPDLNWNGISVDHFFMAFPSITTLRLSGMEYNRNTYRHDGSRNDVFYGQSMSNKALNFTENWFGRGRKGSANFLKKQWNRENGGLGKFVLLTAGVATFAALGAGEVASKAGTGIMNIFRGVGSAIRDVKDM